MKHHFTQIWDPISTLSGEVDTLFWFLINVTGFATLLIIALLVIFAIKYRKRPGYSGSHEPIKKTGLLDAIWIGVPLVTFMIIFYWGAHLYFRIVQTPPNALQIYSVAKQWMWKFQHPEGQREINVLHVPTGVPVQVTLISQDVIHSFFVPAFRVKTDAVPNRYTNLWFEVRKPGEYPLLCSQYCGLWHSKMIGKVIAMPMPEYEAWLAKEKRESMVYKGEQVFEKFGCAACHARESLVASPIFDGLYGGKVHLSNGRTIIANESYIRESILDPGRVLVAGYQNVMPTFKDQLTEEEILELIAFIKSLGASNWKDK